MADAARALYGDGPTSILGNAAQTAYGGGSNLENASSELSLNDQERNLYNHHLANLAKGGVRNADGTTSTALATTVGFGDKTYVIPTVWDNKIVSVDEAVKRARAKGIDSFPSYKTKEEANSRYMQMHKYMEGDIK